MTRAVTLSDVPLSKADLTRASAAFWAAPSIEPCRKQMSVASLRGFVTFYDNQDFLTSGLCSRKGLGLSLQETASVKSMQKNVETSALFHAFLYFSH